MKKKILISLIMGIVLSVTVINQSRDALDIIESKFNISLPDDAQVIKYSIKFKGLNNRYVGAKVKISEANLDTVKKSLTEYVIDNNPASIINYYERQFSWWDLNEEKLESEFTRYGKSFEYTRYDILIVKDEGDVYLYFYALGFCGLNNRIK